MTEPSGLPQTSGFPREDDVYASRYRVVREVGRGGMGFVYEAHDLQLDRRVALKVVQPAHAEDHEYAVRFAREAQVLAQIRSRHTVTIHEHGDHEGTVFLVTDLMPDGDLHSWLVREGPLPWRAALSVTAQVCEALEDTHRAGIVHRDVKPSNVLLWARADGLIAFLCDFGIAAPTNSEAERALNEQGLVIGSTAYMAPERLMGTGGDDERGDVYSAGCLLWATLTGEAPYSGTDLDVMRDHVQAPIPQLATGDPVDDLIDGLLRRVLAKDPDDRLPTAADFRRELRTIHSTVAGSSQVSGLRPLPPSAGLLLRPPTAASVEADDGSSGRRRSSRALVGAAAIALVALLVTAVVLAAGRDDARGVVEATDRPAESPPVSAPTANETVGAVEVPDPPEVTTRGGDREVRFTLAPPNVAGVVGQYRFEGVWASQPRRVVIPTEAGGRIACLEIRSVVGDPASPEVVGPTVRRCGESLPPTVRFVASSTPCSLVYQGFTYPCRWYGVRLTGYADGQRPLVVLGPVGGPSYCTDPVPGSTFRCRRATVDDRGRATIEEYVRIASTTVLTVRVGSARQRQSLAGP